jgi:hypothetical protein
MRVTDVTAESALTRDTVPVNVDAVFWFVQAGAEYENRPLTLHLRAMNMLYEAI